MAEGNAAHDIVVLGGGSGGYACALRAAELGIRKIDAGANSGYFIFEESNKVDPKRVLKLIHGKPKEYRLDGPLKLRFTHDARTDEKLFVRVEQLVEQLT